MVPTRLMTAGELLALGEAAGRLELIDGEVRELSPASGLHGLIGSEIHGLLWAYVRSNERGELFMAEPGSVVRCEPDTVLSPDAAIVLGDRLAPEAIGEGFVPFAPDLAVEVESPSSTAGELHHKLGLYLDGGTRMVWLVRPASRTVTVFRPGEVEEVLREDDTLTGYDLLPGLAIPLAQIFRAVGRPR